MVGIKLQRQMKETLGVPTVDAIKEMVKTSEVAQNRALIAIYNGQTKEEKDAACTEEDNGIGFSGIDAEILTSFAKQFLLRQYLSPKQRAILAKKMPKYAGQLWRIAVAKKRGVATLVATAQTPSAPSRSEVEDAVMAAEEASCIIPSLATKIKALEAEAANAPLARHLFLLVEIARLTDDLKAVEANYNAAVVTLNNADTA